MCDGGKYLGLEVLQYRVIRLAVFRRRRRQHIDQAIDGLSSSLKVVFLLREMEGLSTQETAEVLGLSETAVKTRLSRARLQMREHLSQYYGERMAKGVS